MPRLRRRKGSWNLVFILIRLRLGNGGNGRSLLASNGLVGLVSTERPILLIEASSLPSLLLLLPTSNEFLDFLVGTLPTGLVIGLGIADGLWIPSSFSLLPSSTLFPSTYAFTFLALGRTTSGTSPLLALLRFLLALLVIWTGRPLCAVPYLSPLRTEAKLPCSISLNSGRILGKHAHTILILHSITLHTAAPTRSQVGSNPTSLRCVRTNCQRRKMEDKVTKAPRRKIPPTAIFWDLLIWRREIMRMGREKRRTSMRMLPTA